MWRTGVTVVAALIVVVVSTATEAMSGAPTYVGTIGTNKAAAFVPMTIDAGTEGAVAFATTGALVAVQNGGSPTKHTVFPFPSGVTTQVAALLSGTVGFSLLVVPASNTVQVRSCAAPCSAFGVSCSLALSQTVTLPGITSATTWVAITFGYAGTSGQRNVFLFGDDLTVAQLECPYNSCSFVRKFSLASVFSPASTFPYVLSATGGEFASTAGMGQIWVTLGGSPRAASARNPGVVLELEIDNPTSVASQTYVLGSPDVSIAFGPSPDVLALSSYVSSNTTLTAFDVTDGTYFAKVSYVAGGTAVSGCATGEGTATSRSLFVVANSAGVPGLTVVYVGLSNGAGSYSAAATSGNTPVTTASCRATGATVWVPTTDSNGNSAVVVYKHGSGGSSSGGGSTGYSGGTSGGSSGGGSTGYTGGTSGGSTGGYSGVARNGASGSSASSSGDGRSLRTAPMLAGAPAEQGCVDKSQSPTCLKACPPLPAIICGPGKPPPALVDGRPAGCYILPSGPDACNFCPADFARFCP